MSCQLCHMGCGFAYEERVTHARSAHGYPNCSGCDKVFKSVGAFEKHVLKPHDSNVQLPQRRRVKKIV